MGNKPEIGSTEAAVRSCVSLMAAVMGQSEELIAYWLDLYYQVRSAYEREARKDQPEPLRPEEVYTLIREILHEELAAVAVVPLAGIHAEPVPITPPIITDPEALAREVEKAVERTARAMESQGAGDGPPRASAPTEEAPEAAPEKTLRGWAAKKNLIRNRLLAQRKKGVTLAEIEKASDGALTDKDIIRILNTEKVPTETYKRLEAALAELER